MVTLCALYMSQKKEDDMSEGIWKAATDLLNFRSR